jgi:hypothetical protein
MDGRKEARQKYLESLKQQRENQPPAESSVKEVAASSFGTNKTDLATKREKLLEEKRRAFFQKQQEPPSASANVTLLQKYHEEPSENDTSNRLFDPAPSISLPQPVHPVQPKKSTTISATNEGEDVNLNQWKNLGFPSEYAYAKSLGLLKDKPKEIFNPLPSQQPSAKFPASSALPMQQSVIPDYAINFDTMNNHNGFPSKFSPESKQIPFIQNPIEIPKNNNNLGFEIGNISSKEDKLKKQMDYARELKMIEDDNKK